MTLEELLDPKALILAWITSIVLFGAFHYWGLL